MANRRRNNRPSQTGHNSSRPQHNKASVFDSNGPDVRIRGTAFQIVEKYMTLAKDASASGDRVLAENYLQHAEHYQRLIGSWADEQPAPQQRTYHNNHSSDGRPSYAHPAPEDTENYAPASSGTYMPASSSAPAPDVMVTRPPRTQRPVESDDDLGLPASILGATGNAAPSGNTHNMGDSDDQPNPTPRTRRVAITAG